jgi:hypothetical protein
MEWRATVSVLEVKSTRGTNYGVSNVSTTSFKGIRLTVATSHGDIHCVNGALTWQSASQLAYTKRIARTSGKHFNPVAAVGNTVIVFVVRNGTVKQWIGKLCHNCGCRIIIVLLDLFARQTTLDTGVGIGGALDTDYTNVPVL